MIFWTSQDILVYMLFGLAAAFVVGLIFLVMRGGNQDTTPSPS